MYRLSILFGGWLCALAVAVAIAAARCCPAEQVGHDRRHRPADLRARRRRRSHSRFLQRRLQRPRQRAVAERYSDRAHRFADRRRRHGQHSGGDQRRVRPCRCRPNGYRGAVLLTAGHYDIATQLNINASGVVLRGVGRDTAGTVLHARGTTQRTLLQYQRLRFAVAYRLGLQHDRQSRAGRRQQLSTQFDRRPGRGADGPRRAARHAGLGRRHGHG